MPKKELQMDHIKEATERLKYVQNLLDVISRNIYTKNDIDKELADGKLHR